MTVQIKPEETLVVLDNAFAKAIYYKTQTTLLCELKDKFIPFQEFKTLLTTLGEFVKENSVSKFILDKRNLKVFDQPAMTWYHLEWKKEMMAYGLKTYRKLLPEDKFFRMSVDIGRQRILKEHPEFNFEKYDIQYCETIEEAFEK
ncbi:MAG TPA: hypothetical protein DCM08_13220 [Microscillaceae bacterium]|jgi:NAD(P)H-flavin reductase|nr:hypothetical protein [Microscillaceae bacterium]